jgi:hypothetical protein
LAGDEDVTHTDLVPAALVHGNRLARRAAAFALDDEISIDDAANRLFKLAAGDADVLTRALDHVRSLALIPRNEGYAPTNARAMQALTIALERTTS